MHPDKRHRAKLMSLVEKYGYGDIAADNFRDFTFANAVRLWGTQNPRFFEGTRRRQRGRRPPRRSPNPSPRRNVVIFVPPR